MINSVTLIGRVGSDPKIRKFDNGGSAAEFSVATDDSYKNKDGEKIEVTDWHNVKSTFPNLNDVIEKYVKKGMLVYVTGKIKTRTYDDKDGNKKYVTEIIISTIKFLSKGDGEASSSGTRSASSSSNSSQEFEDDLPF